MFGITGIRIKIIEATHEDSSKINEFLDEYDGNIIDIKTADMLYGVTKFIIVYKVKE